jgi:hypothetical protein
MQTSQTLPRLVSTRMVKAPSKNRLSHKNKRHAMSRILFHYTSAAGHAGILKTQTILPSLRANNPKDARFGDGPYLSDIVPNTRRPSQLSMLFFGIPWVGMRFAFHIDVNVDGLTVISGRQYVFVIPGAAPLDISKRLAGSGRNL